MKTAFVSSEVYPFAKTGGLADVSGTLPIELSKLGVEFKLFMPRYYSVDVRKYNLEFVDSIGNMNIDLGGRTFTGKVFRGHLPDTDIEIYFIDSPHFYNRKQIYTNDTDEDCRFIFFQKAVLETLLRLNWRPDIIHCNDWQTGLIPIFVKENFSDKQLFNKTSIVFTVHNIAYHGRFGKKSITTAGIDSKHFSPGGPVEFYGDVNFLKAGITFADVITTVSKTYAKEILTPEYGAGLDGVVKERKKDLYGILNGVDYNEWNPVTDKFIPQNYSTENLELKIENKKALCNKLGLRFDENIPLIGIVSRLATQKGFDIIFEAIRELMELEALWVVLGSGEKKYEENFTKLSQMFPQKFAVNIGYNTELSHLIEAGADIFLMPSHYEPCGLNQIYSLKYGTVPVVRKTGGLADTVKDWDESLKEKSELGTGFSFENYSGAELYSALKRAVEYYYDKKIWTKIQLNGMAKDYSWQASAAEYKDLYEKVSKKR